LEVSTARPGPGERAPPGPVDRARPGRLRERWCRPSQRHRRALLLRGPEGGTVIVAVRLESRPQRSVTDDQDSTPAARRGVSPCAPRHRSSGSVSPARLARDATARAVTVPRGSRR